MIRSCKKLAQHNSIYTHSLHLYTASLEFQLGIIV
jgi:hypothetical protein